MSKEVVRLEEEYIRFDIITAHPAMFESVFGISIIKRAIDKNACKIVMHNLYDYALDRYKHIDDTAFGGDAGMVIKCQPIFDCVEKLQAERDYDEIIYMAADGKPFDQGTANELSLFRNIIIICGHYKGIDQRVRDALVTREITIGDYVLSGGEIPAMAVVDSVVRLLPDVLGDVESALDDSYQDGLLEAPVYTKPADWRGMKVPEILTGGHHKKIKEWQDQQAIEKTARLRPDLLKKHHPELLK
jgi:tRNA (guanine37-N1)-methyltransferase